ncbi:phosphate acetyl/butaryl transferase [Legionella nautarum]|uniref:Phosphate acetyl/butaryl transferase n=1 Tax=Legionella nautarum TaxID=45070 RepID=A0A0W0WRY0_9GAMM|nr:bifunctional enoyl-CoA hydratase/phosphate acetyltransferase [Legionella nautarum]KTD35060.1 phosphate acetyl/butaryl transferase [Legionella nautarum]
MSFIENKTFEELKIADSAQLKRTLTSKDIELFSIMSGDVNPAHVDAEYAKDDMFHKIIAQGMWGAALISTVLGTELPGPGTIYLDQTLQFTAPVVPGDTVTVTVTVTDKNPKNHIVNLECSCVNQHDKTVIRGIATVIAPTIKVKRERVELPKVLFKEPKGAWYNHLIRLTEDFAPLKTAIVHPVDKLALQGAIDAAKENIIIPILVGPKDKIVAAAIAANLDISAYEIIPTKHSNEAAEAAVQLARECKVEALMKGKIHTDELMGPIIAKETGLLTGRRMSHVFYVETPNYSKPLFISDAALNIQPNLQEKKDITQNAIDLFRTLGFGTPKVAIVCAIETVSEKMQSTLDAAALSKMAERDEIRGAIVDGPLAFDNAISIEAAREKGIKSDVAGDADIIIVPDMESGNMLYKEMTYMSGMEAAGIVMGARVPIILTSRGSDDISRKASCALALAYVRHKEKLIEQSYLSD